MRPLPRGFAVVADEVRNLSQRTQQAVNEASTDVHQLAIESASDVESVGKRIQEFRSLVEAFEEDDD